MTKVMLALQLNGKAQKCELQLDLKTDTVETLKAAVTAAHRFATDVQVPNVSCCAFSFQAHTACVPQSEYPDPMCCP